MVHRPRAQFYVCFDSPSRSIVLFSALIVAIVNGRGAPASKASGTLTLRGRSTMMRSPSALQDFVATGFSRCCMKLSKVAAPAIVGLLAVNLAHAKPKKADVPAAFQNARYVYVQAEDGDILNPRLFPEDRQSISDVEDKVREWHRYAITINRSEADLVFVVRRGRLAGAQLHGGISGGSHPQPGQSGPESAPRTSPTRSTEIGARGEFGPPADLFRFYLQREGQLGAKIWERSSDGGLDAPSVQLVQ